MVLMDENNNLKTFNDADLPSMGEFLIGQLEKLDQRVYGPLYNPEYKRDIDFRQDISIYDTASSYQKIYYRATNGVNNAKTAFTASNVNANPETGFEYYKVTNDLHRIERSISYSLFDLERSKLLNKPIDSIMYDAMQMAHQMEVDRAVYTGLKEKGTTGLFNNADAIANETTLSVKWETASNVDDIVQDINNMFFNAWKRTAFNVLPTKMIMPPSLYSFLVSRKVSEAGNVSVLNYVRENSIVRNKLNILPEIVPSKWLEKGIDGAIENRIIVYEKNPMYIRLPYIPLQRFGMLETTNNALKSNFVGVIGNMEVIYPEILNYFKVKTV